MTACSPATDNCRKLRFSDGSGPITVTVKVKKVAYNFNLELYNSHSGYKFAATGALNGYIEFGSINASTGRFVSNGTICSAGGQVYKICPTYNSFYGDVVVFRASDSAVLQPISGGSNINQVLTAMTPRGFSGSAGEVNCDMATKICRFYILGSGRTIRAIW